MSEFFVPAKPARKDRASSRRLPSKHHDFKELTPRHESVRNLTPPQTLAPDGSITSSRGHEVSKSDPLLLRIKELEAENAALRKQLEKVDDS
jgi:hypothetical protein